MKHKSITSNRFILFFSLAVLLVGTFLPLTRPTQVSAAQITDRSLTLQAGATDGGSLAGGVVDHFYEFTIPTGADVGSIEFLYCTTASGACTTPAGLDTTSASLGSESGATGFSIVNTTNGSPYLTRTAATVPAATPVSYQLQTITNPTTVNQTFYVRVSTYQSTDTSGSETDSGTVTASTAEPIVLTGTMPESLVFCTGETISTTDGVPDCTTATSGAISFDRLFSPQDTALATSQMAASTNAGSGYAITVNGTTLTSGSNTIDPVDPANTSIQGSSQFGMNLKANTTPTVGTEVNPASDGIDYYGVAQTGYATVDNFKYTSGDIVADSDSDSDGTPNPTDAQIFTKSYIVNVPGNQPAGTYTTTLTYICTATF